jgi:chromosome segregation ATPase
MLFLNMVCLTVAHAFSRRFQGDRFWIDEALLNIDLLEGVIVNNPSTPAAKTHPVAEIPEETIRKLKEELQEEKKVVKEQKCVISRLEGQMKGKEKGLEKAKAGQEKAKADLGEAKADLDKAKAGQEKLRAENKTLTDTIQEKEGENEKLREHIESKL